MFKILIFICAANLAPQECQENNAIGVIVGPTVSSELSCGLSGHAYCVAAALRSTGEEYVKIQCRPSSSIVGEVNRK
jgi:hypothetical protein